MHDRILHLSEKTRSFLLAYTPEKYVILSAPLQCSASSVTSQAILPVTAQAGRSLPSSSPQSAYGAGARTALLPKQGTMSGATLALAYSVCVCQGAVTLVQLSRSAQAACLHDVVLQRHGTCNCQRFALSFIQLLALQKEVEGAKHLGCVPSLACLSTS